MQSAVLMLLFFVLSLAPVAGAPEGQGGMGGGASMGAMGGSVSDPTPFELFVKKLKLDSKKQLPEVERIFSAAATEAGPISLELIRLRGQMAQLDGKPDQLKPVEAAFTAASARMVAAEVKAFRQVQALLKPDQAAKSAEAFVLMGGIFNPPTPRTGGRTMMRGRGGQ